jgi:class 3 adenylate cyclase
VIAGVIGEKKFIYDLWGDTVNIASRMQTQGPAGCIQVTEEVYERLKEQYHFEKRGTVQVKGKGKMTTYLLTGRNGVAVNISSDSWLAQETITSMS